MWFVIYTILPFINHYFYYKVLSNLSNRMTPFSPNCGMKIRNIIPFIHGDLHNSSLHQPLFLSQSDGAFVNYYDVRFSELWNENEEHFLFHSRLPIRDKPTFLQQYVVYDVNKLCSSRNQSTLQRFTFSRYNRPSKLLQFQTHDNRSKISTCIKYMDNQH